MGDPEQVAQFHIFLSPIPHLYLPSQGGNENPMRMIHCNVLNGALGMEQALDKYWLL